MTHAFAREPDERIDWVSSRIDVSYYVLRALALVGLVSDLRTPPRHVLDANRIRDGHPDVGMFEARFAQAVSALRSASEQRAEAPDTLIASTRAAALRIAKTPV